MRLWHYKLIPVLPRAQLLAQWRELNTIFSPEANSKHILIDYIAKHGKTYLLEYSCAVIYELFNRGYKVNSFEKFEKFFDCNHVEKDDFVDFAIWRTFPEHDHEYLTICYWNLREKYIRGQKDFTEEIWNNIQEVYNGK